MQTRILQLFTITLLAFLGATPELEAQSIQGTIIGQVTDAETKVAIPYTSVVVVSRNGGNALVGGVTDEAGKFKLQFPKTDINLIVSFMGYQSDTIEVYAQTGFPFDVGRIELKRNTAMLNAAEIRREKSTVEFKLDKRVFNVGKDISSTGVGALDVLNNVPSVNVNIEGQISLRGNTGVQILINGKPSVLTDEGSNALGSITADMIDRIEVITNPSAKYEAGGTSGIINIVLRKEEKKGFNGSASVNTGIPANHSVGVSLNRRTENFNFFTQFGAGYRSHPRYGQTNNIFRSSGGMLTSDGIEYRNEDFYNITLGTDYHIDDRNVLTLSGSFAYEVEDQPSETTFDLYNERDEITESWRREEVTSATNPKWQYDLQYKKEFKNNEEHVLLFSTLGSFFGKDQQSAFTNTALLGSEINPDQRTETSFYQADYTAKLDYTNPITKRLTIEAGGQYNINDVGNEFAVFNEISSEWVPDLNLTNDFTFDQKVLGFYGTASYEDERWGLKLGLRSEQTDLKTLLVTTNENNNQKYSNLFPTAHTSYKFSDRLSVQAGYSRRIRRPRLWDLNPFFNIRNNYNIRMGNPALQPEFSNSYEITSIITLNKASFSASIYHLHTTDVIERVAQISERVTYTIPMNIGENRKTGLELTGKYTPNRWLSINGDANYGYFSRVGAFEGQNFDFTNDQWSSRLTAKFKLPYAIEVEVTGDYQSGFQTVQSMVSGFLFGNAGIRKKLWNGKGILDFNVRDIFASRIQESVLDNPDNYLYSFSQRGRFLTLGFSYSFGKGEAMTYSGRRHR